LRFLIRTGGRVTARTAVRFGARHSTLLNGKPARVTARQRVDVLVRMDSDARRRALEAAGMRITGTVQGPYTVAIGHVALRSLGKLGRAKGVHRVEGARELLPELDLCIPEVRAQLLQSKPLDIRGQGALIGIIDSGIDYEHPDFRLPNGKTRIRYLWDQGAEPVRGGKVRFGREYTSREINAALRRIAKPSDVPAGDELREGHGTHVASIAAGRGRLGSPGMAPGADLIVVRLTTRGVPTLGRSNYAVHAFQYMVERAAGKPIAINLSRGMNGGGHSGETAVETAIDNLARRPNVAIVKSAGNERLERIHASGKLRPNETRKLTFEVLQEDRNNDVIEVWFDDRDEISFAVKPPTGRATRFVDGDAREQFRTRHGNKISIDLDPDLDDTGDTVATIVLSRGGARAIQSGTWTLLLKSRKIVSGSYHAWIERVTVRRETEQTRFTKDDPMYTVTVPGTARNVITVGSYVTRQLPNCGTGVAVGQLSATSSLGPTRYGHRKPDLAAPGEMIVAARAGTQGLIALNGTSMAAPAVTGIAALIMSRRQGLRSHQLKQILVRSARRDGAAADAPDDAWGHGKLDAASALEVALEARFPSISDVRVEGTVLSWRTDSSTTSFVRFATQRRQLLLGKNPRVRRSAKPGRMHEIDFRNEAAGTYFCEIVAVGPNEFFTEEDGLGRCFQVHVPTSRATRKTPTKRGGQRS
jgi:subtilisin family serine protease